MEAMEVIQAAVRIVVWGMRGSAFGSRWGPMGWNVADTQ